MKDIRERFKDIARFKGLSVTEFEVAAGLSNGLVGKLKNPSIETILKVANRFPDISMQWLLTGEGEMIGEVRQILGEREAPEQETYKGLPFLDGEQVVAGPPAGEGIYLEPISYIKYPGLTKEMGEFAVKAKGRSMIDNQHPERSIPDGAVVVLSTKHDLTLSWGETYCLATRNGYVIKRIIPGNDDEHITCISNNEEEGYTPYEILMKDIIMLAKVTAVLTLKNL